MAEYIKREYAVDAALDVYYDTPDIDLSGEKFEDAILKIPAADVVEVVRCKDCKWGKTWKNAFGIEGFKCDLLCVDLSPEAFCSYGVRKGNVLTDGTEHV